MIANAARVFPLRFDFKDCACGSFMCRRYGSALAFTPDYPDDYPD